MVWPWPGVDGGYLQLPGSNIAQEVWFRDFVSKIVYYMYTTNKTYDIRPKKLIGRQGIAHTHWLYVYVYVDVYV